MPVTPGKVPFDYTGHHADSELGLVDMGARLYDPVTARFLTTDPVVSPFAFSQSHNPYSYVMNAPLVYTDPTGRDAELVHYADGSYGLRDMVTGGVLPIPAEEVTVVSPALPRTTSDDVAAPEPGTVQPPDTGTQGLSAIASSAPAAPEVPGPAPRTADEVRAEFWTGFAQGTFLFGAQILKDMFEQSGLGGMGLTTFAGDLSDRYYDNGGGFWGAGKTVLDLVDPTGPLGVIPTGAGDIVKAVLDADPRSRGATAAVVTWSVVIAVATAGGGKGGPAEKGVEKPPGGNGTGKKFTPDFSTKNTKNLSATFKSQGEAVYATEWWTADALGKDQYYPAASLLNSGPAWARSVG